MIIFTKMTGPANRVGKKKQVKFRKMAKKTLTKNDEITIGHFLICSFKPGQKKKKFGNTTTRQK